MKAIVYALTGGPDVLELVDRPVPDPADGEVRVKVEVSGVNPTDWKSRSGLTAFAPVGPEGVVPHQDGSGVIDAVGAGVDAVRVGQRVWIWEAAYQRPNGTAQEYVTLPESHAVPLPDDASFDLGASLAIPAITAHRVLTVADGGPTRLQPGALDGANVLVAGGAGAVGHAAIQLARWAGALVVTTVSSDEKSELARLAGAHHVVNYRTDDVASEIRRVAPGGVDIIAEVAPAQNMELDSAVMAPNATIAIYANNGGSTFSLSVRDHMGPNTRFQFVLLYTMPDRAKQNAVEDISAALRDGALPVGAEAGLPLHHFPLEQTGAAQSAVEAGAIGKVLVDVTSDEREG